MKNLLAKLNFKLTKLHLFLILVAVLILASLGFSVKEYFDGQGAASQTDNAQDSSADQAMQGGEKKGKNFESMIADLEDVVIPGRKKAKHHHDKRGRHWPRGSAFTGTGAATDTKEGAESKEEAAEAPAAKTEETTTEPATPMAQPDALIVGGATGGGGVDLSKYILKSNIVPPVCPKCPDAAACPRPKPCSPCPPCARCPEPAFECKKVPNYNALSASNVNGTLPLPRLNSFAQFN